jgi:hypothetical protein
MLASAAELASPVACATSRSSNRALHRHQHKQQSLASTPAQATEPCSDTGRSSMPPEIVIKPEWLVSAPARALLQAAVSDLNVFYFFKFSALRIIY